MEKPFNLIATHHYLKIRKGELHRFTLLFHQTIDIFDITTILNYLIGNGDIGEAQKTIADFNNDDVISIEDIIIFLNNILNE